MSILKKLNQWNRFSITKTDMPTKYLVEITINLWGDFITIDGEGKTLTKAYNNFSKKLTKYKKSISNNIVPKPDFNIKVDGKILKSKDLHFMSPKELNHVFYIDSETGHAQDFEIKGSQVLNWFDKSLRGEVL